MWGKWGLRSLRLNHLGSCGSADSDSVALEWGLRCCISHQLPGDAHAAGPQTTLEKQKTTIPVIVPLNYAKQASISSWLKIKREIYWFLPFPTSNHLAHLKENTSNPFLFSIFSLHILLSSRTGAKKALGVLREAGPCSGLGFPVLQKVKMDSVRVLQLGEQEPLYIKKTKSNQPGYWDFFCFYLLFYKYP